MNFLSKIWKPVAVVWKIFLGVTFCQAPFLAVLVIGWVYRLMQRSALKQWWQLSSTTDGYGPFNSGVLKHRTWNIHATYPNWFVEQRFWATVPNETKSRETFRTKVTYGLKSLFVGLGKNAKAGIQGIFNIWVLTIIPCMLWNFGWYSGWIVSFNKGYENFSVGITLSFLGIFLFCVTMMYLPMAQARQAVSGEWKSFYDFRLVRTFVRQNGFSCMLLALGYSLISLPVTLFKFLPFTIDQINPNVLTMTDSEFLAFLQSYFFWTSIVGFLGYVFLHRWAARIYARSVVACIQNGSVKIDELSAFERQAVKTLKLDQVNEKTSQALLIQWAGLLTRRAWRVAVTATVFVIWFSFVGQIYVSEFFNYHPVRGWMNQSLVQLPWFEYVPSHLTRSAQLDAQK
jgi:hypothetical protein